MLKSCHITKLFNPVLHKEDGFLEPKASLEKACFVNNVLPSSTCAIDGLIFRREN